MMYSCARLSLLFLGFLHVSLYQQVDSSLLGHVNLSASTPVWKTLSICPTGSTKKRTWEKLLSVVGKGIGLSFTVQITEGASEIALDQPHTVDVQRDEVRVFQFISPQGISDKQLDITVTSQSTVGAYLKVSQNCRGRSPGRPREHRLPEEISSTFLCNERTDNSIQSFHSPSNRFFP